MISDLTNKELYKKIRDKYIYNKYTIVDESERYGVITFSENGLALTLDVTVKKEIFLSIKLGTFDSKYSMKSVLDSYLESGVEGFSIYHQHLCVTIKTELNELNKTISRLQSIYKKKENILSVFPMDNSTIYNMIQELNRKYISQ